ncbi:MAG: peptidyl-prolyl cis-trans isomerase [Phycisphaerales bacterium JB039]
MKGLLREPLVHFLALGAALFVVFSLLSGPEGAPRDDQIIVTAGKIEHLAALFARTWQRPPTRQELEGLIADYVREEAAYREGMAFGLDTDDTVIRRRIRQKLDFIAEDVARQFEPTEAELQAYLEANPDAFRQDPIVSFRQIYLNPEQRPDLEADARDLLIALEDDRSIDASTLGDRILLEHAYADVTTRQVSALFGAGFAAAIAQLEPGAWHGPVASGYGAHRVRRDRKQAERLPELAEIRDLVQREWANARRLEAIEQFYADLVARYDVTIAWPQGASAGEAR